MTTEMTLQLLKILLSVAGTVILTLFTIIGYFFKQNISVIKSLQITMQGFREEYIATREQVSGMQNGCLSREKVVDKRLNSHADRLDDHDRRLVRIETTADIKN